jgi:ribonuclease HII
MIIAVDEVGRGALAGPVVVVGVIAQRDFTSTRVRDSKKLTARQRYALLPDLTTQFKFSVSVVESNVIDQVNILNATKMGMQCVVSELKHHGDLPVYVDGNQLPFDDGNIFAIVGGDNLMPAISLASIIAKCLRDDLMRDFSIKYPYYHWHKNAGYGTKQHRDALLEHGPTPLHRLSFISGLKI